MIFKKNSIKTIITISFLTNFSSTWNMENNQLTNTTKVPLEILEKIFLEITPLKEELQSAIALRSTCNFFYGKFSLEHLGKLYQHSNAREKTEILNTRNDKNYGTERIKSLIIILSGGQNNNIYHLYRFMCDATRRNDEMALKALFKNGININKTSYNDPVFFNAKNKQTIELFKNQGIDLNQKGERCQNVLWSNILHNPSSDLIATYIEFNVNVNSIDPSTGDCLLHFLARHPGRNMKSVDDYVKIGALLITPEIINKFNNAARTPLDEAFKIINEVACPMIIEANKELIGLFLQHGGKTAMRIITEAMQSDKKSEEKKLKKQ